MVLMGVVIFWSTRSIFSELNRYFASLDEPAHFILLPQTAIWWIAPISAAIDLTWEATLDLWALIGDKDEVALYSYWTTAKAGFDSTRVLRIMAVVLLLPMLVFTALAIPWHVALRGDDIRTRGYGFTGTKAYRYSDARRMTVIKGFGTRDGKLTRRAGIVLDFADGRRWSSADIGDFKPDVDPLLVNFLGAADWIDSRLRRYRKRYTYSVSAWSRSAMMSSTASIPIESRSRLS